MNNNNSKPSRKILLSVTLFVTLCTFATIYASYARFQVLNRGDVLESIKDLLIFYGRGRISQETMIFYGISIICLSVYWLTLDKLLPTSWKVMIRSGIIAVLIAPSVFVNPENQPAIADLLMPHKQGLGEIVEATILPAWRIIWKNRVQETYDGYKLVANMLSIWPIFFCWSLLLWMHIGQIWRRLRS